MSDSDGIPLSGGGQTDGSQAALAHVEAARVRGSSAQRPLRSRRRGLLPPDRDSDRLDACDDVEPWATEEARRWWRARKTA